MLAVLLFLLAAGLPDFGAWRLIDRTAEGRLTAYTSSDAGAQLAAGCVGGRRVLFVAYPSALAGLDADEAPVRWRIDGRPVRAERWAVSGDRAGLVADPFTLEELADGGDHLALEAFGRLDVFELAGADAVLDLIVRTCRPSATRAPPDRR